MSEKNMISGIGLSGIGLSGFGPSGFGSSSAPRKFGKQLKLDQLQNSNSMSQLGQSRIGVGNTRLGSQHKTALTSSQYNHTKTQFNITNETKIATKQIEERAITTNTADANQDLSNKLKEAEEKVQKAEKEAKEAQETFQKNNEEIKRLKQEIEKLNKDKLDLEDAKKKTEGELQKVTKTSEDAIKLIRELTKIVKPDYALAEGIGLLDEINDLKVVVGNQKQELMNNDGQLKKKDEEIEGLNKQLADANLEKEQLVGCVKELEGQIDKLSQQNKDGESKHEENGNQIDQTQIIDNTQNNQHSDSVEHSSDSLEFTTPVLRQRSSKFLTSKEIAQAGEGTTIALNRHTEEGIRTTFAGLLNLSMDDRFASCTQDKLVEFEKAIVGKKKQSVTMSISYIANDIPFLVRVIQQLTDVLSGKQGNNTVITGFSDKMQKITNAIAGFKEDKAVYWMLLCFQLNCACEELNTHFAQIRATKDEKGKKFQITMPDANGKDVKCTIFKAFQKLNKLENIFVEPQYSK